MKTTSMPGCVAVLAAALSGCVASGGAYVRLPSPAVAVQTNTSVGVAAPTATIQAQATAPAGVVALEQRCTQGAQEICNGVDDNCNGAIDEGCGYQTGAVQVTAAWNTDSDVDLHVVDPAGEEIYYGNRTSSSGGQLDHDANAACAHQPPTVENVFWSTPNPPRGRYLARVVAYDMCNASQTPTVLSISVGGRIIGTYQFTFQADRQEFAIPFTIE